MRKIEFDSQSGKSLIEILVVLAVGGILVSMAIVQMTSAQSKIKRQNFARELKVNLERARFDATKRRAGNIDEMAQLNITSATSYNIKTDINQDGVLSNSEIRYVDFSGSNVRMLGTIPLTLYFDRFGSPRDAANNLITPAYTFCEGECTLQTATVANSNIISISAAGTVAMLNGGESIPAFADPSFSTVSGNDIDEWLIVSSDNPTPNPTPSGTVLPNPTTSPTTSPTVLPTASPEPTTSPTATPSPSTSPSVSPTPVYCQSGQRPTLDRCVCKLPLTTRGNGVCK